MICPSCKEVIPDDSKFCMKCGKPFIHINRKKKAIDKISLNLQDINKKHSK